VPKHGWLIDWLEIAFWLADNSIDGRHRSTSMNWKPLPTGFGAGMELRSDRRPPLGQHALESGLEWPVRARRNRAGSWVQIASARYSRVANSKMGAPI